MIHLPRDYQSAIEEKMVPDEQLIWVDQPIPKHVWTLIGTTYPRGRIGRAISLVVFELMGGGVLFVGLMFLIGFFGLIQEFRWTIPEFIALAILAPITIVVLGGAYQIIMSPRQLYLWAKKAHYVLTTHNAFIVWDNEVEVKIKQFKLERIYPSDVYRLAQNGVGDVVFDSHVAELVGGDSDTSTAFIDRGFFAVANAKEVLRKVDEARIARQDDVYGIHS